MKKSILETLALTTYSAVTWLVQPLLRLKLARRAHAEPVYAQQLQERFGRYDPAPFSSSDAPWVWVHAVSLGETRAAAVLIAQLRTAIPSMRLLLTHSTATGRTEGIKLLRSGDQQVWLPWDTGHATRCFMQQFQPVVGVLMETEVWPNLCKAAQEAGVPLVLANARLSEKSLHQTLRLKVLSHPAYRSLTRVLAQTSADAQRLQTAGASRVHVLGNLKFDATVPTALVQQGQDWRVGLDRPVVMLAVSREGEETAFLEQIKAFESVEYAQIAPNLIADSNPPQSRPKLQWLIVPRHPQRFDAVQALVQAAGFTLARRSSWQQKPLAADVWLGDSLGEMALYYGLADVALLGGSFAPLGGQNLIEAIACGCPVVMGPHTFNFADAADTAQSNGAAYRVSDMAQGLELAVRLARDTAQRSAMQAAGAQWLGASRGAAEKTAQQIAQLIQKR